MTVQRNSATYPFIIIRLWPQHHASETDLQELLAALKRNRRACDEVWFCTAYGFPPLDEHARAAEQMAAAAEKVRAVGIAPGLQISNTLGHGLNLLADNSGAVWPMMVDADGTTVPPAPCPRATGMLDYVDRMTRLSAAWQPSSLWIDDDLRMNSHGTLKYGCFCPVCLRQFSREQGRRFTRQSLVKALHMPCDGSVRLAWTRFNAQSLAGVAKVVATAARAVAPECRLGFQQIGHEPFLYSGPDWSPVLRTLARGSRHPAGARLGHGYYTDHQPRQMVQKAFMMARQIARLPACVDQVCPEVEGFNHNAFGKSAHGVAVESSLDPGDGLQQPVGWESAPSGAKRNQYLAAADWIARGKMPVMVDSPVPAMAVPRVRADGSVATVALLNTSIDQTGECTVRIRTWQGRRVEWVMPGQAPRRVRVERRESGAVLVVPSIPAWSMGYLRVSRTVAG